MGVATCSNLYGLKVLSDAGSGSTSGIIAALSVIKARHISSPGKKTVVSMSLGGGCAYVGCTGDAQIAKVRYSINSFVTTVYVSLLNISIFLYSFLDR